MALKEEPSSDILNWYDCMQKQKIGGSMLVKIGYVRKSIHEPDISQQVTKLKDAGVDKIIEEKDNAEYGQHSQFQNLLHSAHESDEIFISSLDCLEHDTEKIIDKLIKIDSSGASLEVLDLPHFTKVNDKNVKREIVNVLIEVCSYMVDESKKVSHEKQRKGIAIAKAKGKYTGKKREYSPTSKNINKRNIYYEACRLLDEGETKNGKLNKRQISRVLGISPATLYNIDNYRRRI